MTRGRAGAETEQGDGGGGGPNGTGGAAGEDEEDDEEEDEEVGQRKVNTPAEFVGQREVYYTWRPLDAPLGNN